MSYRAFFIAIEGLDGSGKTSVSKRLVERLEQKRPGAVKWTFEPHDASCAGEYIRQVLKKQIAYTSPQNLMLAYAANRLDHGERVVGPWLEGGSGRVVVTDRYYLSSLVYQSSADVSFGEVLEFNRFARKPDLFFFINVSDEVCYQRLKTRNLPEELFDKHLSELRDKYLKAIDFLQKTNGDLVVEIDGNGSVEEVVEAMLAELTKIDPSWSETP